MKNICILDSKTMGSEKELEPISSLGNTRIYKLTSTEERLHNIGDADVIVTNKVIIDKTIIDNSPNLKLVCLTATGTNNVDLEYAKEKGIAVRNVAGYSTNSVAQHTFSMLFHLMSKLSYYDSYVKSGAYAQSRAFNHIGPAFSELSNKTWGIIGLGAIGRKVAEIAKAFGCEVIYYSTSGKNDTQDYTRCTFDELLQKSDFISIHAPLYEKTENLIGIDEFHKMKSSAFLINVARGKIVNEKELAEALNNNIIKGACLDVLENEPILNDSPLLKIHKRDKLLITPHIAWTSIEARKTLIALTAKNITDFYS